VADYRRGRVERRRSFSKEPDFYSGEFAQSRNELSLLAVSRRGERAERAVQCSLDLPRFPFYSYICESDAVSVLGNEIPKNGFGSAILLAAL